jgi:aspartate aminotransferase
MVDEFKNRRDLILNLLEEIKGIETNVPQGAFYVFPDVSYYFGRTINGKKINSASDVAMLLLEEANVATVTGEAFGAPDCIRISYAASQDAIKEAIYRIAQVLN